MLLDSLNARNGQTLRELCAGLDMARQSVSKHLAVLEAAGLVTTVRRGREKLHYLNAAPISDIAERWISRYDQPRVEALADLKKALEETEVEAPSFVYTTYIRTTPERLWQGLTDPAFTRRYWQNNVPEISSTPGMSSLGRAWDAGVQAAAPRRRRLPGEDEVHIQRPSPRQVLGEYAAEQQAHRTGQKRFSGGCFAPSFACGWRPFVPLWRGRWLAQAGGAGLGGGVGGRAREGLAVAGQQQGGVDGVECCQGGEGRAAVVGECA
jgi:DNA-binding transcriptional ArsR family regulator